MASYSEMIAHIQDLKKQAEKMRKEEYSGVLKAIKRQIAEYGITAEELGFRNTAPTDQRDLKAGRKASPKSGTRRRHPSTGSKIPPRYRDLSSGKTWTGRGKQPRWVVEALSNGIALDSFLIAKSDNG